MLLADALVLDRHLPARERDEPRACPLVAIEQRGAAEGVGGGRQPPAGYPLSGTAELSAARRHWSTATANPSHPEKGRSGVCWARSTPRTPSGSRTSSTYAVTGSAGDMLRSSRQRRAHRIGSTPDAYPDIQMASQTTTPDPELLERDAELLALDQALAEAVDGHGSVVAVEGPPGIGKSSLVSACIELAREREMFTIAVRATELERSYPYGLVRQSADSVALGRSPEERAALFTGAARLALPILDPASAEDTDSPELMYQRLHGLYWLTANLARERPLLITIDDAQWADDPSMAAQRFLSLRIADLPMVLLLAVRTVDVGPLAVPLAEVLADPATVSIRPAPLSPEGAGQRVGRRYSAARPRSSPQRSITPPAATRSCSSSW